MTKLLAILLIGLVFEAVGVVYLSQGLHEIGEVKHVSFGEISRIVVRGLSTAKSSWRVIGDLLFWRAALFAFAKGCQPHLAADVAGLCHHGAGGPHGAA